MIKNNFLLDSKSRILSTSINSPRNDNSTAPGNTNITAPGNTNSTSNTNNTFGNTNSTAVGFPFQDDSDFNTTNYNSDFFKLLQHISDPSQFIQIIKAMYDQNQQNKRKHQQDLNNQYNNYRMMMLEITKIYEDQIKRKDSEYQQNIKNNQTLYQQSIKIIQQQLKLQMEILQPLTLQKQRLIFINQQLQHKIGQSNEENQKLFENYQKLAGKFKKDFDLKEKQNNNYKEQMQKLNNQIKQLNNQIVRKNQIIKPLQQKLEKLESETQKQKSIFSLFSNEKKELKKKYQNLQKIYEQQTQQLRKNNQYIDKIKKLGQKMIIRINQNNLSILSQLQKHNIRISTTRSTSNNKTCKFELSQQRQIMSQIDRLKQLNKEGINTIMNKYKSKQVKLNQSKQKFINSIKNINKQNDIDRKYGMLKKITGQITKQLSLDQQVDKQILSDSYQKDKQMINELMNIFNSLKNQFEERERATTMSLNSEIQKQKQKYQNQIKKIKINIKQKVKNKLNKNVSDFKTILNSLKIKVKQQINNNKLFQEKTIKQIINKYNTYIQQLKKQINKLNQQNDRLTQQLRLQKDKNKKLQKDKTELQNQITQMKEQIKRLLDIIKQLKSTILTKDSQLLSVNQKLNQTRLSLKMKQDQLSEKETKLLQTSQKLSQTYDGPLILTQSTILDPYKNKQQIKYISECLKQIKGAKVHRSKTLFKMCSQDPHLFIDDYPNLLLIIHLKSGQILCGFTEEPFHPDAHLTKSQGCLINVTKRKIYRLKDKNQKSTAITYDPYFIIFGNSEIRIRTNQQQMFSNFSAQSGYFDNKKDNLEAFIGDKKKQQKIIYYEYLQIKFENTQFAQRPWRRELDKKKN